MTPSTKPQAALPLIQIGKRMQEVRDEIRTALESHRLNDVRELAGTLQEVDRTRALHLVLVGQHDAGKSLLARCLTGRPDIEVGAGPLTDTSSAYEWGGHLLVDTPGVEAGVREEHDSTAAQALQSADVVLFVLTVEGMDDVIAEYFSRVVESLRSTAPLVIVINKAGSEAHDRSVAEEDVQRQLGPVAQSLPIIWTDALDWEEAPLSPNPPISREVSGVEDLAEAITRLLTNSTAWLRLLTPIREWRSCIDQALDLVLADIGSENSLGDIDAALEHLDQEERQLTEKIERLAAEAQSHLIEQLSGLGPTAPEEEHQRVAMQVLRKLNEDSEQELVRLEPGLPDNVPTSDGQRQAVLDMLKVALNKGADLFAQSQRGEKGHQVVRDVGHALRFKFRPHGIIKTSRNLSKSLVAAGLAIDVGTYAADVWGASRAAKRTAEWDEKVGRLSTEAVNRHTSDMTSALAGQFEAARGHLHRQRLEVVLRLDALGQAERTLAQLGQECDSLTEGLTTMAASH